MPQRRCGISLKCLEVKTAEIHARPNTQRRELYPELKHRARVYKLDCMHSGQVQRDSVRKIKQPTFWFHTNRILFY